MAQNLDQRDAHFLSDDVAECRLARAFSAVEQRVRKGPSIGKAGVDGHPKLSDGSLVADQVVERWRLCFGDVPVLAHTAVPSANDTHRPWTVLLVKWSADMVLSVRRTRERTVAVPKPSRK